MKGDWVDFKVIKAAVTIEMVLQRYGIALKHSGQELRGKCPIHRGSDNKHFTANISKNVFKCFFAQCDAHGNVLDFVAAMEHCSVREAAVKMRAWFKVGESVKPSVFEKDSSARRGIYQDQNGQLYEVMGTAIDGEDKNTRLVYRELFGDYRLCVGSPQLIQSNDSSGQPLFHPVKFL
jgi:DNA primase